MHAEIRKFYDQGRIWEGVQCAKRHISEYGEQDSQLEIYLMARGLYAGGFLHEAYYWVQKTIADPINRIPFTEMLERKLG